MSKRVKRLMLKSAAQHMNCPYGDNKRCLTSACMAWQPGLMQGKEETGFCRLLDQEDVFGKTGERA